MVNVSDMSPEEAKKYLEKQQKKIRERQKAYVKKQLDKGKRRINTYISSEAGEILDVEMDRTGKGTAEIISDALQFYAVHHTDKNSIVNADSNAVINTTKPVVYRRDTRRESRSVFSQKYDRAQAEARIQELSNQGMGPTEIAGHLEAEGVLSPGGGKWHKGTIARIIQRLRDGND